MEYFPIAEVRARLEAQNGGWEVVHESPNLEVGVLVRIAPTPDPPVRHTADEVYVVLAGEATLEADGESRRLRPGDAAFVAVGTEHHFVDYELIFGPGSLRSGAAKQPVDELERRRNLPADADARTAEQAGAIVLARRGGEAMSTRHGFVQRHRPYSRQGAKQLARSSS